MNRLEDSLLLWKSVVSNKLLAHVSIILFLNKVDLLQVCCYSLGMQGDDTDAYFRQSSKAVSDSATICRAMVTDQMITKMYLHVGGNSPFHQGYLSSGLVQTFITSSGAFTKHSHRIRRGSSRVSRPLSLEDSLLTLHDSTSYISY